MLQRTELLVHAGAPSSRKDDDRYKAQAEAYFGFQGRRIDLEGEPHSQPVVSTELSDQDGGKHQDETTVVGSPTIFLDDTQLAITGLESQLLTSSLPIASGRVGESSDVSQSTNESGSAQSTSQGEAVAHGIAPVSKDNLLAQIRSFGKRKRDDDAEDTSSSAPNLDGGEPGAAEAAVVAESQGRDARSSTAPSLSSYLKTPILDRSAKKRRPNEARRDRSPQAALPKYVTHPDGSQSGVAYVGGHGRKTTALQAPAATAPAAVARSQSSLAVSEPTSELPTSYSLSDITSESSRARVRLSQRSASDPGSGGKAVQSPSAHVDTSTSSGSNGSRLAAGQDNFRTPPNQAQKVQANQEVVVIPDDTPVDDATAVVPAKRTGVDLAGDECKVPGGVPPSEQFKALQQPPSAPTAASTEALRTLRTLSATIRPPEPETSIKRFATHITPSLANLASNENMAGRYNPASTTRDLRPSERGYWLFDTSTWSPENQVHFWQFLEKAIGGGSLGWGVWCNRDLDERGNADGMGLGTVKVYCWGEVVKHVYLLLYVASKSQMRKLGAQWADAQGEVVVQMPKQR